MRLKVLLITAAAILLMVLSVAPPSDAAFYNGQDIDGIVFDGAIYLFDFDSGEPVKAVFSGYQVTIYWQNGEISKYLIDPLEIEIPEYIELFTDPEEPQPLVDPILEIFL
ncbi:MAG TPA: hypothetical protein PLP89_04235 [Synergistales bacterium]|jgi:hypothetical protein|nr:hypothetical protein [Synergistales bacterium]MDI9393082.1 hypothetical protein [Synergistota bacterium]MDY0178720.1 hypothetical protein [Synergistaceae bacterium]HRV70739.1 hypothetical protein [Thermovirgaceae bacterium]MDD3133782.1 hypothetical protein [Synergistales bacterium]